MHVVHTYLYLYPPNMSIVCPASGINAGKSRKKLIKVVLWVILLWIFGYPRIQLFRLLYSRRYQDRRRCGLRTRYAICVK